VGRQRGGSGAAGEGALKGTSRSARRPDARATAPSLVRGKAPRLACQGPTHLCHTRSPTSCGARGHTHLAQRAPWPPARRRGPARAADAAAAGLREARRSLIKASPTRGRTQSLCKELRFVRLPRRRGCPARQCAAPARRSARRGSPVRSEGQDVRPPAPPSRDDTFKILSHEAASDLTLFEYVLVPQLTPATQQLACSSETCARGGLKNKAPAAHEENGNWPAAGDASAALSCRAAAIPPFPCRCPLAQP
jgi:hypothetical protein